jgi:hypothetical protein
VLVGPGRYSTDYRHRRNCIYPCEGSTGVCKIVSLCLASG